MTATEMHQYFDILCDKYGSPYFTDGEKDLLLNRAQLRFIDEVVKAAETDDNVLNKIYTLIVKGTPITMSATTGDVTLTSINTATGVTLYKILKVYTPGYGYISQATHNAIGPIVGNSFKAARIRFEQLSNKVTFTTIDGLAQLYFTVVGYPTTIAKPGTPSNLPDLSHNEIVAIAIDLAGIALRDDALAQLNQLSK